MAFGHNIDQRKINKRNKIIDLFRQHKVLSKARAKELSGYSMDTVISIFKNLTDEEIVIPSQGEQKNKGRKATFYSLNHEKKAYLGITFNHSGIFSSIVSFSNEIIEEHKTDIDLNCNKDEFMQSFKNNLNEILSKGEKYSGIVSAVGCSLPGEIDNRTGIMNTYPVMPTLGNLDFKGLISSMFPEVPVKVDPKIKSMTSFLLQDHKLYSKYNKIMFINARTNTNNGFIFNGDIFTGQGEFGHIKVSDEDVMCSCGRKGCLNCYFSFSAFKELFNTYGNNKNNSIDSPELLTQLSNLYESSEEVRFELDKRLYYFAHALVDIINVTVPELIILSGELLKIFKNPAEKLLSILFDKFIVDLNQQCVNLESLNIVYKDYGFETAAFGICNEMIRNDWSYSSEEI